MGLPFVSDWVAFEVERLEVDVHVEAGNFSDRADQVWTGVEHSKLDQTLKTVKGKELIVWNVQLFQVDKACNAERRATDLLGLSQC